MNILKTIKLKLRRFNLLFFIFSILYLPVKLFSIDIYDFGMSLYKENDYYRAISEFERYIFYNKNNRNKKKVNNSYIYIVKSYYYAEQYNSAIKSGKRFANYLKDPYFKNRLTFWLATSYLMNNNYNKALKLYLELTKKNIPEKIDEYSYYRLIWIDILQKKWNSAIKKLNNFEKKYPQSNLKNITSLMKIDIKKGINFSPLSPTVAAILSTILPGAGQVYTKRIGDGIVAFSLIAALTYGTYYYYQNGPQEISISLGVLDIIFYIGNIYTAFGSAHKYNINFNEKLSQDIFNNYFENYDF